MRDFREPSFEPSPGELEKEPQGEEKESERRPDKTVLLVRHPSTKLTGRLMEQAEAEGKDIETHVPIDKKGLRMAGILADYLQTDLAKLLGEKNLSGKFTIYTSPIKRAGSEARIISKRLKLAHLDNPEVPIPKNNKPIEANCFAEIPWIFSKKEAEELIAEAEERGIHPVKLWFEKEPDKVVEKLNGHLPNVERGIEFLGASETPVDIVFSHRVTIALMLWVIEQRNRGREDLTITQGDLPAIAELTGRLAYTSINEIRCLKEEGEESHWQIHSIGTTPHLDEKAPEIDRGTF